MTESARGGRCFRCTARRDEEWLNAVVTSDATTSFCTRLAACDRQRRARYKVTQRSDTVVRRVAVLRFDDTQQLVIRQTAQVIQRH